jgi:hypothetical protein
MIGHARFPLAKGERGARRGVDRSLMLKFGVQLGAEK